MQMLKNVVRNFLKRPATRKYPFVKRDPFENYRGRLVNHVDTCIFCRMCSTRCPAQCISTNPKEAFWGYDPFACVYCGICVDVCPTKSLFMLSTHRSPVPQKFVVYHKGQARVARPRVAAVPKVSPGEIHRETPPANVIAAIEHHAKEQEVPQRPTPAATPAPVPPGIHPDSVATTQTEAIRPAASLGMSSEAIAQVESTLAAPEKAAEASAPLAPETPAPDATPETPPLSPEAASQAEAVPDASAQPPVAPEDMGAPAKTASGRKSAKKSGGKNSKKV